jgi:hypothetical protein
MNMNKTLIPCLRLSLLLLVLLTKTALNAQLVVYNQDFNASSGNWTSYEVIDESEKWNWNSNSFTGNTTGHWSTSPFNPYNNDIILLVESPSLNFTGKTGMTFSTKIRYQTESAYDGVQIEYSINGGLTWIDLGARNQGTNWYNDNDVDAIANNAHGWSGNNSSWQTATLPLPTALNNQSNVKFRFYFASDYSVTNAGTAFDDILITNSGGTIYNENFNSNNGGWIRTMKPAPGKWNYGNTSFTGNNTNHWHIQPHNNYANLTETALTSQKYDLTPYSGLTLEFKLRYDTEAAWDGIRVEYTTDSITWKVLGALGQGTNWYNDNDVDAIADLAHGWSGDNTAWTTVSITLPTELDFKPGVFFRFRFASDGTSTNDDGAAIDDVKISVLNAYVTKQSGNLSTASTWLNNTLPPTNAKAFILSGHTVNVNANQTLNYELSVLKGATLNLNANTLTIARQLQFETGSFFNAGTGTVSYSGTIDQAIAKANFYNLTLAGSGIKTTNNTVTITNNLSISTAITLNTNNRITLLSTATNTARILAINTGAIINGKFIIQRYIGATNRTWWHLSSPFNNATVDDWQNNFPVTGTFTGANTLTGSNSTSIFWYDETNSSPDYNQGWTAYPTTDSNAVFSVGKGYRTFLRQDKTTALGNRVMSTSGTINRGNINLPVSYTVSGGIGTDGWSFIGNPYPCDIDWNAAGWTKTRLDNAIYVWDPINAQYTSFVGGVGSNGGTRYIASSQGFWVRANAANPALQITEAAKSTNNSRFYRESALDNILYVDGIDGEAISNTVIRFSEEATSKFDGEFDAEYLSGSNSISILSHDLNQENWYSINAQPDSSAVVPLWIIHSTTKKERKLRFTNVESFGLSEELLLVDKFISDTVAITEGMEYAFTNTTDKKSNGTERFHILRNKTTSDITTSLNKQENTFGILIYPTQLKSNESVNISINEAKTVELTITTMLGQNAFEETLYIDQNTSITPNLSKGVYIITINADNKTYSQKIIVE